MDGTCSQQPCERPLFGQGRCKMHWQQWYRSPDFRPAERRGVFSSVEGRFWSKVDKTESCWLWTAARGGGGYGHITDHGRLIKAHRWSYEQAKGPVPEGLTLDHLCRVPACVNPDHLEAVTEAVNIRRAAWAKRPLTCEHGHPWTGKTRNGYRTCDQCHARYQRELTARIRAARRTRACS